ncbi:MAG TPA: uridine diphosphate-N-acetylglucosamine-binding protein YvcK [Planctomycetota bacterium]|jgi:uncharacterized cofD-like protein
MPLGKLLKWLRPGLRIKRWIAVIFLGLLFAVLAWSSLLLWLGASDSARLETHVFGIGITSGNALLIGTVFSFSLSGFCLITGIYRLIKSMWDLVDRRGARKGLVEAAYERAVLSQGPKVVAIGGGTGLSCVLTGLKKYSADVTAIVSMADDGGSSGKLRQELGISPPGDIRKCLIALADEEPLMSELLDYRFPENELGGHNFGNLFLTALARIRGDFGEGVREANQILSVRGRVLPSTLDNIMLVATHEDESKTTGQALICKTQKRIKKLDLRPEPQPVATDIVKAIEEADLIVIGPGSLYTSVIPNLLIKGMAEALSRSKARKVFVCNIMTYEGETRGYQLPDFLKAIDEHTFPHRVYDCVLVNDGKHRDTGVVAVKERNAHPVRYEASLYQNAPFQVIASDVVNPAFPIRHDTMKLADTLVRIMNG